MSSRNLLASLFDRRHETPKSSGSSASLFSKTLTGSSTLVEKADLGSNHRSMSAYKSAKGSTDNKFLPLIRATHTLGVKIKKLNYFLFCKLENHMKEERKR